MKIKIHEFHSSLYDDTVIYGLNNKSILDKICALLIALSPILQHYKGLYANAGVTALILISPYLVLKLLFRLKNGNYTTKYFFL